MVAALLALPHRVEGRATHLELEGLVVVAYHCREGDQVVELMEEVLMVVQLMIQRDGVGAAVGDALREKPTEVEACLVEEASCGSGQRWAALEFHPVTQLMMLNDGVRYIACIRMKIPCNGKGGCFYSVCRACVSRTHQL